MEPCPAAAETVASGPAVVGAVRGFETLSRPPPGDAPAITSEPSEATPNGPVPTDRVSAVAPSGPALNAAQARADQDVARQHGGHVEPGSGATEPEDGAVGSDPYDLVARADIHRAVTRSTAIAVAVVPFRPRSATEWTAPPEGLSDHSVPPDTNRSREPCGSAANGGASSSRTSTPASRRRREPSRRRAACSAIRRHRPGRCAGAARRPASDRGEQRVRQVARRHRHLVAHAADRERTGPGWASCAPRRRRRAPPARTPRRPPRSRLGRKARLSGAPSAECGLAWRRPTRPAWFPTSRRRSRLTARSAGPPRNRRGRPRRRNG